MRQNNTVSELDMSVTQIPTNMYGKKTIKMSEETLEDETNWFLNYGVETETKYLTQEDSHMAYDL